MRCRRVPVSVVSLLVIAFGIWGCGDDATGPEEDMLTLEESEALMEVIQLIGVQGSEEELATFGGTITVSCPGGGEVTASGTAIPSGTETGGVLSLDLTLVPTDCVVTADGRTFTLNGSPSLRETGTFGVSIPTELTVLWEIDLAFFGTLAYELGGRSGICDISARTVLQVDLAALSQTGSSSGTVCGNTVDVDLSGPIPLIPDP